MRTWTGDSTAYDRGTLPFHEPLGHQRHREFSVESDEHFGRDHRNIQLSEDEHYLVALPNVHSSDGLDDGVMNNSSPEAQLFFQNFTNSSQTHGLLINAVTNCDGDEGAASTIAVPPSNYVDSHGNPLNGLTAVESEMTQGTNSCTYHSTP